MAHKCLRHLLLFQVRGLDAPMILLQLPIPIVHNLSRRMEIACGISTTSTGSKFDDDFARGSFEDWAKLGGLAVHRKERS
ncbi:hypothetical protein EEB12_29030 [Rhodococcus sp. WS1]|nr:hypothetical protein EEB12_29030 [Rhodococcus sp. WS1]